MYVGLQIATMVKMIPGWMTTGHRWYNVLQHHYSQSKPDHCEPFHELKDMVHNGQVFRMEQCTNLYFLHFEGIEVINDLVESFQMYSTHIINQPQSAAEYRSKQTEQASYYEKIIRNIDIVLQMDQVACIHEGLPQVPSPRYVPTQDELENDNISPWRCRHHG